MMVSAVAGFQIQMIPLRWYIDDQKDKNIATETCCFINQEAMQNFSGILFTSNPSTVPITITTVLYRAAKKKVKYGEVWGLARQATQFAVNHDSHGEMIKWLKQFINRHKEMQSHPEVQVDDTNKENELGQIENPLVLRHKECPETKRYKSSTKKKPYVKYTCDTCDQLGYNSARCQNQ